MKLLFLIMFFSSFASANCIVDVGIDLKNSNVAAKLSSSNGARNIQIELSKIHAVGESVAWALHLVCITENGVLYRYTAYRVTQADECYSERYSCSSVMETSNDGKYIIKDDGYFKCKKESFFTSCD